MEISVDNFGRVIIPKSARDRLGLGAGDKLDLEVADDALILRPHPVAGRLVREGGVLVWSGTAVGTDTDELIRSQRDARSREILGTR